MKIHSLNKLTIGICLFIIIGVWYSCKKTEFNPEPIDDNSIAKIYILNTGDIHEMSYYLPRVAHYIKQFKATYENVLLIDAGDRFTFWPTYELFYQDGSSATVETDLKSLNTNGNDILQIMALFNYDAMIIGNHEWVYSIDTLSMRIQQYDLPVLSCNIIYPPNLPVIPSRLFDFKGIILGVVGVTPDDLDHVLPTDSVDITDPTSQYVKDAINALQNNSDLVILVTHELDNTDETSAYTLQGFDLLIGGHSHNALNEVIIGKVMTKAGLAGMYIGITEILWDIKKDKLSGINYRLEYLEDYPHEDAEIKALLNQMLGN